MKILNSIALMLSLAIMVNNNSYTSDNFNVNNNNQDLQNNIKNNNTNTNNNSNNTNNNKNKINPNIINNDFKGKNTIPNNNNDKQNFNILNDLKNYEEFNSQNLNTSYNSFCNNTFNVTNKNDDYVSKLAALAQTLELINNNLKGTNNRNIYNIGSHNKYNIDKRNNYKSNIGKHNNYKSNIDNRSNYNNINNSNNCGLLIPKDKLIRNVVHFHNGVLLCSLASLNQCLSVLNPGNNSNSFLKQFIDKYNKLRQKQVKTQTFIDPRIILKNLMGEYCDNDQEERIFGSDQDISERLITIFEIYNFDAENVLHLCRSLTHTGEVVDGEGYLNIAVEVEANNEMKAEECPSKMFLNKVFKDKGKITVGSTSYDLVSLSLYDGVHYISIKRIENTREDRYDWVLLDSYDIEKTKIAKDFGGLKKLIVNKIKEGYHPRLLFFTKNDSANNNMDIEE